RPPDGDRAILTQPFRARVASYSHQQHTPRRSVRPLKEGHAVRFAREAFRLRDLGQPASGGSIDLGRLSGQGPGLRNCQRQQVTRALEWWRVRQSKPHAASPGANQAPRTSTILTRKTWGNGSPVPRRGSAHEVGDSNELDPCLVELGNERDEDLRRHPAHVPDRDGLSARLRDRDEGSELTPHV